MFVSLKLDQALHLFSVSLLFFILNCTSSLKVLDDILTNARAAQDAEGGLFCVKCSNVKHTCIQIFRSGNTITVGIFCLSLNIVLAGLQAAIL